MITDRIQPHSVLITIINLLIVRRQLYILLIDIPEGKDWFLGKRGSVRSRLSNFSIYWTLFVSENAAFNIWNLRSLA